MWVADTQTSATFVLEIAVAGSRHATRAIFFMEVAVAGSRHADYSYLCVGDSSCG